MKKFESTHVQLKQWAEEDRPREKLILKGRNNLSDAELLAILIGSGNKELNAVELSKQILKDVENDLNKLGKLGYNELKKYNGIGEAKAITIISALELGRRRDSILPENRKKFTSSADIYKYMKMHLGDILHEEFWVLLLDRKNQLMHKECISSGGIAGTVVDCRMIFKMAIDHLASSIILIHNHPSGDSKPSDSDIKITNSLIYSGKMLDLLIIDHLILSENGYFSFADHDLI